MMSNNYAKAYKELLEIIKHFPLEEYNRIPKEKIKFYEENMDKNYNFTVNPNIDLSEQNISKETKALIVTLYEDCFATKEQKEKIKEILELNQKKAEQEKRKKYNPGDLFKNQKEDVNNNEEEKSVESIKEVSLVEYKENFFTKFKNFILKLLHIKS